MSLLSVTGSSAFLGRTPGAVPVLLAYAFAFAFGFERSRCSVNALVLLPAKLDPSSAADSGDDGDVDGDIGGDDSRTAGFDGKTMVEVSFLTPLSLQSVGLGVSSSASEEEERGACPAFISASLCKAGERSSTAWTCTSKRDGEQNVSSDK